MRWQRGWWRRHQTDNDRLMRQAEWACRLHRTNTRKTEKRDSETRLLTRVTSWCRRLQLSIISIIKINITITLLHASCDVFFLLLSYSAPPLPKFPLEFRGEVNHEETRVMGLLSGESCMILPSTVFDWSTRVTDGRTDGRATAYSALRRYSIYAVAR